MDRDCPNDVCSLFSFRICQIFYYIWSFTIDDSLHFMNFKIHFVDLYNLNLAIEIGSTIIISYGAFVGRINFLQLYFLVLFESIFNSLNYYLVYRKIELDNRDDPGQALGIHLFEAFFGVATSWISGLKDKNVSTETSKLFV